MKKLLVATLIVLLTPIALSAAASASTCSVAASQTDWIRNSFTAPGGKPTRACVTQAQLESDLASHYNQEEIANVAGYYFSVYHKAHAKYGLTTVLTKFVFSHEYGHAADYWIGYQTWGVWAPISNAMPGLDVEEYATLWSYLVMGQAYPGTPAVPYVAPDQLRSWQALGWLPYGSRVACSAGVCVQYVDQAGIQ